MSGWDLNCYPYTLPLACLQPCRWFFRLPPHSARNNKQLLVLLLTRITFALEQKMAQYGDAT